MATKKEIEDNLKIALKEVGEIKPVFKKAYKAWIFKHKAYPDVTCEGETREEVIKNYPLNLRDFIEYRLKGKIDPSSEKRTKGRGGKREGAGRPKGTTKEPTTRISLPKDIANWFKYPQSIIQVRQLIAKGKH